MVVCHLRGVKHTFSLLQGLATNGFDIFRINGNTTELGLVKPIQRLWTFRIDVVRKVLRIHTRISGVFLLIQCLDEVQRHLCRIAELPVAVHLQRGEVIELGGLFLTLFLLHLRYFERLTFDGGKSSLTLFLRREFPLGCRKGGVAIDGGQYPIRFWLEVVYLLLPVHNKGEGRGLYASDAEHLTVLTVLQGIEPGGVHA